jgi:hypothetical protein
MYFWVFIIHRQNRPNTCTGRSEIACKFRICYFKTQQIVIRTYLFKAVLAFRTAFLLLVDNDHFSSPTPASSDLIEIGF